MALERPPVRLPEVPESPEILRDLHLETQVLQVLPARQVLPESPEILRRFPVLEKIPYVIAPFK